MPRSSPKPRASASKPARGKGAKAGAGGRLQTLALFVTLLAVGALLASLGYGIWQHFHPPAAAGPVAAGPSRATTPRRPVGRVNVEVLNATKTNGLARTATAVLRDGGFDVVSTDNGPGFNPDSSLVLDRVGNLDLARQTADALGIPRVETRRDSTRLVDVTVVLGNDWKAPALPR
ncbi:MAG TPA: LytR C-terminal domain-containing protein [Longimicrobium sp.]|nr:LytR C-terminal domain-containing protein [Longimicrobium sp.]